MSDCCTPRGYRRVFSKKSARRSADRYRKKGLDAVSRRIVELVLERPVEGASVMEVGGGVGAIQVELLAAGAARAVSVELTPTYEEVARELLRDRGLEDRVERKVEDFVEAAATAEPADIVVMNRVVCCYPEMPRLVRAAASRTEGLLVMSFPKRTWWTRAFLAPINFLLRLTRQEFQIFLHPPEQIRAAAAQEGLRPTVNRRGFFWEISALERQPAPA